MKSYNPRPSGSKLSFEERQRYEQQFGNLGNSDRPPAPREVQVQPGARKVLLTWSLAAGDTNTAHWRVYRDTESNLEKEITDRGTRQLFIDVESNSVPIVYNFFVSGVSIAGVEGPKVQAQGSSLAEIGAPPRPDPPVSFTDSAAGGGNKSYGLNRLSRSGFDTA